MNTQNLSKDQMELGFNRPTASLRMNARGAATGSHPRRQTRLERAAWWFGKMRQTVDAAISWAPRPTPPPQQLWFVR